MRPGSKTGEGRRGVQPLLWRKGEAIPPLCTPESWRSPPEMLQAVTLHFTWLVSAGVPMAALVGLGHALSERRLSPVQTGQLSTLHGEGPWVGLRLALLPGLWSPVCSPPEAQDRGVCLQRAAGLLLTESSGKQKSLIFMKSNLSVFLS